MAVPALSPDVAIIHAQQADRRGNVAIWGITGIQKEAVLSARARDRHGRGGRRGVRAAGLPGRACRPWPSTRSRWCPRGLTPPTPTAITTATTPSTRRGTRSAATASASGSGWSATSSAREDFAEHMKSIERGDDRVTTPRRGSTPRTR